METHGKQIEEIGYKAEKGGFFNEWQMLTLKYAIDKKLSIMEAAERAYTELLS